MNKRSAGTELLEAYPAKRPHNDNDNDNDPLDNTYPIIDAGDDDITTAETPNSFAGDVESPVTVATTPRARFPSDLKTLPCTWPGCPKTFNRPARLRDHLNSHTNSRPFKCTYEGCDKDYIEDKHLKQHVKAVHTNERNHVCPREGCGKTFVTGTRLKRHQAVHEGADRFRCAECGQSFRKKETLHKHVLKAHRGEAPHQCAEPGCAAKFESKGALKRHHQRAHGELKFWCGDCALQQQQQQQQQQHAGAAAAAQPVGFTTQALLHAHMRAEHQDCMFCDFRSASQAEMVAHVDARHSGRTLADRRRAHPCDRPGCPKTFTKRSNLRAHQRTAHDGFRFVCGAVDLAGVPGLDAWRDADGCGDKFCTKVRLEDHVRYVHLRQERPPKVLPAPAAPPATDGGTAEDLIEELSGVRTQSKKTVVCPHCPHAFARYHDLEVHVAAAHVVAAAPAAAAVPEALFADGAAEDPDQDHFIHAGGLLCGGGGGGGGGGDDGIFAAEMHYGTPRDEWLDDELGIMMLARGSPALETHIDPTLGSV